MMSSAPLAMRIMASSIAIANQAGKIIRDIMSSGELGIVDKVRAIRNRIYYSLSNFVVYLALPVDTNFQKKKKTKFV